MYRNLEGDYELALTAARRMLDLQQRSGVTNNLYFAWMNVGQDLLRLGRAEQAMQALTEAHRLAPDAHDTELPAIVWRNLIQAELAGGHVTQAHRDAAEFDVRSRQWAPEYHLYAELALANVAMHDSDYRTAIAHAHNAYEMLKPGGRSSVRAGLETRSATTEDNTQMHIWVVVSEVASCITAAVATLPYADSIALAGHIERDFADLPVSVSALARKAVLYHRRISGEFDSVLSEQAAAVEKARSSGNRSLIAESLRDLAATYGWLNAPRDQTAVLVQAVEALGDSRAELRFPLLLDLGQAALRAGDFRRARSSFDTLTKDIEKLPAAERQSLAWAYGSAMLGKARLAELEDDPDTAREILEKALKPATFPNFDKGAVLRQLARLERDAGGRASAAIADYEQGIAAYESKSDHLFELAVRLEYATWLAGSVRALDRNLHEKAATQIAIIKRQAEALGDSEAEWRVLFISGMLAEARKNIPDAIANYKQAVARLESIRIGLSNEDQRRTLMDDSSVQDLNARLLRLLISQNAAGDAWNYLERGKARTFSEVLGSRAVPRTNVNRQTAELGQIEERIAGLRMRLAPENARVLRAAGQEPAVQLDGRCSRSESE